MKNLFKKIDNFIVNKITLKSVLYIVFAISFMNCHSYFVIKYRITNLDNMLMILALNFSTLFWIKIFTEIKNRE